MAPPSAAASSACSAASALGPPGSARPDTVSVEHQVDVDVRGPVEVQREQPGDGRLARARYAGEQVGPGVLPGRQCARRGGQRLSAQPSFPLGHHRGDLGAASARAVHWATVRAGRAHWSVWPNVSRPGVRRPGPSLRVKLVAVTLCLLAAGAAVIVAVGASALRGQLTSQAGAQLRAYVNQLTSHPFQVLDTARGTPVTTAPFDATGARAPGTASLSGRPARPVRPLRPARRARRSPRGDRGVQHRTARSERATAAQRGPGTRPGQALPAPFAPIPAQTGELRTVQATGGGEYLVIAEPVHLQARRLVFGYGADDFAVTAGPRAGQAGTLVVGLQLAGIGQTVQRLTLLAVAVSATAILIAGGLAWAAIRFSLRPVTRAAQTADAVAAA